MPYFIQAFGWYAHAYRITPFGNLRVTGYVLLSAAFRSLSRPSSPYSSIGIRHEPIFRLTILSFPFLLSSSASAPGFFIYVKRTQCLYSLPAETFIFLHLFLTEWLHLHSFNQKLVSFSSLHFYCQRTSRPKTSCFFRFSWRIGGSNPWPSACKADALASWANSPRLKYKKISWKRKDRKKFF